MNELKRDEGAAATELSISKRVIEAALAGEAKSLDRVLTAVIERWPVSPFSLQVHSDHTDAGVSICFSNESYHSARIINRGGTDYYEYRDTAVIASSPIRPEWIRMLVDDYVCDPASPVLQWNRGHALHQLTWFLGPANFYWEKDGRRFASRMEAGDSAYIPSWTPHTFARPFEAANSAIVAVTFHATITNEALEDLRTFRRPPCTRSRLSRLMAEAAISTEMLHALSGVPRDRILLALREDCALESSELVGLAAALEVPTDLLRSTPGQATVAIERARDREAAYEGDVARYAIVTPPVIRPARGLLFDLSPGAKLSCRSVELHQYVYVLDRGAVALQWTSKEQELKPDDSVYLSPGTDHEWIAGAAGAKLLCFRCSGALGWAGRAELDWLGPIAINKYATSQERWYG